MTEPDVPCWLVGDESGYCSRHEHLGVKLEVLLSTTKLFLESGRVGLTSSWTRSSAGEVNGSVSVRQRMAFEVEVDFKLLVVWIRETVRKVLKSTNWMDRDVGLGLLLLLGLRGRRGRTSLSGRWRTRSLSSGSRSCRNTGELGVPGFLGLGMIARYIDNDRSFLGTGGIPRRDGVFGNREDRTVGLGCLDVQFDSPSSKGGPFVPPACRRVVRIEDLKTEVCPEIIQGYVGRASFLFVEFQQPLSHCGSELRGGINRVAKRYGVVIGPIFVIRVVILGAIWRL